METVTIPNLIANPTMTTQDWYKLPFYERNKHNLKSINKKIYSWNELVKNWKLSEIIDLGLDNTIIFSHIYKTAGTTFSKIVANNYRLGTILQANAAVIDSNLFTLFKLGKPARVLIGHFELNDIIYQFIDRSKLIHLTILRNPVERTVSYYDHIRNRKNHILHKEVKDMSLEKFIDSKIVKDINNGQCKRILGRIKGNVNNEHSIDDLFDCSKKLLRDSYTIVGTTDRFDAFVLMCKKLLGWDNVMYTSLNKSTSKTSIKEISSTLIDKIVIRNKADILIYEYITELNIKREAQLKISDYSIKCFKSANYKYKMLLDSIKQI